MPEHLPRSSDLIGWVGPRPWYFYKQFSRSEMKLGLWDPPSSAKVHSPDGLVFYFSALQSFGYQGLVLL